MRDHLPGQALALSLVLLLAACQTDPGTGAAAGAVGGAVVGAQVGGPAGAAVGGVAGAAVGGVLTAQESQRVRTYVGSQRRASIRLAEDVSVGQPLPTRARLYPLPTSVGLQQPYSYTIVNEQTVLVDPRTREIVEIIE